jgi:DNA-binding response OmpR family regulator
MRLLIVEDNQRLLELLAEFLNRTGYRVDTAASVADFHASVATVQYDLIIVDLGLPDGDGLTAIRALRDKGQSMPILVITARGSIEARVSRMAMLAIGILLPMRVWSAVPVLHIVNNRHGKNEECSPKGMTT